MSQPFEALKITENIYWVGAIDWNLRNFHGYETRRGTTYNAFLVKSDTGYILIDTVKRGFEAELISRIQSVCSLSEIKAIISNHAEMDHSGSLTKVLKRVPADTPVYASAMGVKALAAHFDGLKATAVANGSTLTIDGRTFRFVEARMMHWPDSMWTYDEADHVLFSNDAFGMHLAGLERWYDDCDSAILAEESARYFANILMPYAPMVAKACAGFPSLGLDGRVLCPDHGPLWRGEGIAQIISKYAQWSDPSAPRKKAVVVFDSMWHSTERMAFAIAEGIQSTGYKCQLLSLECNQRSDVAYEMLDADVVLVGSPTLNSGMLPRIADMLCYISGLKFRFKTGAAFGSYGWAPLGQKAVSEQIKPLCANLLDSLSINYVPTMDDLARCRQFGRDIVSGL